MFSPPSIFNGSFLRMDGVAMGNRLNSDIAHFYMEHFEQTCLRTAVLKPRFWYRYIDAIFVIWPLGQDKPPEFLSHLTKIHPRIQFITGQEKNQIISFLDVPLSKKPDGNLGHSLPETNTHRSLSS